MILFCYPTCTTCQKAKKWLDARGIRYQERNIKNDRPSLDQLRSWHQQSGLPLSRFFNTSGLAYRGLGLAQKRRTMAEEEQLALLATDGMLVKRPLVIWERGVLVGFKEAEWEQALG